MFCKDLRPALSLTAIKKTIFAGNMNKRAKKTPTGGVKIVLLKNRKVLIKKTALCRL